MKNVLYIIFATLLTVYIAASAAIFPKIDMPSVCKNVEIVISDSVNQRFLTRKDVVSYLKKSNLYPLDKTGDEINTDDMEKKLLKDKIISTAEVVQTPSGNIRIVISQRMPVLRVFSGGESYYVDKKGYAMPVGIGSAISVPVASGNIEKSFATSELYKFALYLRGNDFWNNQIEQIYVNSNKEVEIVPRVGNQRIILGTLDDYESKLEKLNLFYKQVIPKMGWDKYSIINLKYKNQIVCTKNKDYGR